MISQDMDSGTKIGQFLIFREESQDFLFDGSNGVLSKVKPLVADILILARLYDLYNSKECEKIRNILSKKYKDEDVKTVIEQVKLSISNGMLSESGKIYQLLDKEYFGEDTFKGNLWLSVTDSCNLQCSYCFEKDNTFCGEKFMTVDTAKKCIDYWFDHIDKNQYVYDIFFFGGEPLLNQKVILFCVDYINTLLKDLKGIARYNITTNGTIINNDLLRLFKENIFLINVSVDGLEKIHNNHRKYKSGKPTYNLVISNMLRLSRVAKKLSAFICLTSKDIPYFKQSVFYLWDLGIKNVYGNLVFGKNQVYHCEDYMEFNMQIKAIGEAVYKNIINDKPYYYNSFIEMMKSIYRRKFALNCYFWQNGIFVFSPEGDAYRCHRFMGDKRFILGNINDKTLDLLAERKRKEKIDKCSRCWYQLYCGDGCPYENEIYTGNINEPSEMQCMRGKITFEESLRLFAKLSMLCPEKLENLMGGKKSE